MRSDYCILKSLLSAGTGRQLVKKCVLLFAACIFAATTGCQKPEAPVVTISVSPEEIAYGETTTVTWTSANAASCTLNGKKVELSGSVTETPTATQKYSIVAVGEETTATATATVTVIPPDAPVITVTAPTEQIPFYETAKVEWKVEGVFTKITLDGVQISEPTGSKSFEKLTATASHTLVAEGPGGTTTKTFTINVGDWISSPFGVLAHAPWGLTGLYGSYDKAEWIPYNIGRVERMELNLDGTYLYYSDGERVGSGKWSIDGNQFTRGGTVYEIKELTQNSFTIITKTYTDPGQPDYYAKLVYTR